MEKYTVKISNQEIVVWAKNHHDAMKKAIQKDTKKNKVFGAICLCLKYGDDEDDEMIFSIDYLKNNGYFKGMNFQLLN